MIEEIQEDFKNQIDGLKLESEIIQRENDELKNLVENLRQEE